MRGLLPRSPDELAGDRVSEPTKEYLIAKATLCRDLAVKQIVAGEGEQAARNLMRMVKALGEVGIINEREGKSNE